MDLHFGSTSLTSFATPQFWRLNMNSPARIAREGLRPDATKETESLVTPALRHADKDILLGGDESQEGGLKRKLAFDIRQEEVQSFAFDPFVVLPFFENLEMISGLALFRARENKPELVLQGSSPASESDQTSRLDPGKGEDVDGKEAIPEK